MIKFKLLFLSLLLALVGCKGETNINDNSIDNLPKETYVLVHSAWLGKWQWENIVPILTNKGHNVIAPDLPGHGSDGTPASDITMDDYVNTLVSILDEQDKPVILVGHSFNGITISRVAELRPNKVKSLVYMAAFLLPNESSFLGAVQGVSGSNAVDNFKVSDDGYSAYINENQQKNALVHDVSQEFYDVNIKPYIVSEPLSPLKYKLQITDKNFGRIPKYYIETTEDKAIPIEIQKSMYKGNVLKVYTLNSSHCPNFSQPKKLAEVLLDVVNEQEKKDLIMSHFEKEEEVKVHRLFSNENQIFAHFESKRGGEKYAHMALLEITGDKKIYTTIQKVPKNQISENRMFEGAKLVSTNSNNTVSNLTHINKFIKNVWIDGKYETLPDFFNNGILIQHNPTVQDDVKGLYVLLDYLKNQGITLKYEEIVTSFAKGDMVLVYSKGIFGGDNYLFADLFRLENQKIVEHWDVIEQK